MAIRFDYPRYIQEGLAVNSIPQMAFGRSALPIAIWPRTGKSASMDIILDRNPARVEAINNLTMTPDAVPNPNHGNSNYLLPTEAAVRTEAFVPLPASEPPITRHVSVPEKVTVKYMAELSGQPRYVITGIMNQLGVSADRSVPFEDAAEILRKFGIAAERMI